MVFAIENIGRRSLVHVFEGLQELSQNLEWQDVHGKAYRIISSDGEVFEWDKSKRSEFATLYDYTLVQCGTDPGLARKMSEALEHSTEKSEFEIDTELLT